MNNSKNTRPFTAQVYALQAKGYRYHDLVTKSDEARSSSWFNNLVNHGPWGHVGVAPPGRDAWRGLAKLFGITEEHLCELIAMEWFGISGESEDLDPAVRTLVDKLVQLPDEDLDLVAGLVNRLMPPDLEFDFGWLDSTDPDDSTSVDDVAR